MKKELIFIISFINLPNESGNDRFLDIIRMLNSDTYNIEIIYPSFCHSLKKQREESMFELPYKFTMLYEPGYPTNVCLKRLHSHKVFANNVKNYLKQRKKPDLIYCSIPALDVGYECAQYCKRNDIPFFIDIQDLWPEAFKLKFSTPIISDIVFYPMKKKADYIYRKADTVIAVSETYLHRALQVNENCKSKLVVYLGTNRNKIDEIEMFKYDKKDEIWILYVGTLGESYDLSTCFKALTMVYNCGLKNFRFIIMGDGPLRKKFQFEASNVKYPVTFTGRLPYELMISILKLGDIALNPIKKRSAGSVINKVMDYAMTGVAVVNSQENEEYRQLINKYNAGINVECENFDEMFHAIKRLCLDINIRKTFSDGNRKLGECEFDREKTYLKVVNMIQQSLVND